MQESQFDNLAQKTLEDLCDVFEQSDKFDDVILAQGVLTAITYDGKTFVINKHTPLQEIWLSSPISGAAHYAWCLSHNDWKNTRNSEYLKNRITHDLQLLGN